MRKVTETLTEGAVEALSLQDKLIVFTELLDEGYISASDVLRLEKMVTAHIVEVVTSGCGVFDKG